MDVHSIDIVELFNLFILLFTRVMQPSTPHVVFGILWPSIQENNFGLL
jgi:hypothetical protein